MTSEMAARLQTLTARHSALQTAVVNAARPLVAALKDAGRVHSAEALQVALFELDVVIEEMGTFLKENLPSIIDEMKRGSR